MKTYEESYKEIYSFIYKDQGDVEIRAECLENSIMEITVKTYGYQGAYRKVFPTISTLEKALILAREKELVYFD